MSLGRRLYNIARAELIDAARKLRQSAEEIVSDRPSLRDRDLEEEYHRFEREGDRFRGERPPQVKEEPPEIRRYYANLELPIGAPASEVKAAYRRLMRRYHPDRHFATPERAEAATKLAKELRTAYEGLLTHLGEK